MSPANNSKIIISTGTTLCLYLYFLNHPYFIVGGVAALVQDAGSSTPTIVVDPIPSEHEKILAACCIAYLPTRDEVTSLWFRGDLPASDMDLYTQLIEQGILASRNANRVLVDCLRETVK